MNAKVPLWTGVVLTLLGIWGYFGTDTTSITALIPMFFGLTLLLLALAVRQERLRIPALYGVLLVALIGFAGSVNGVPDVVRMLSGIEVERPVAASAQAVMAVCCFGLSFAAAKAVLDERRAQRSQTAKQTSNRSVSDS